MLLIYTLQTTQWGPGSTRCLFSELALPMILFSERFQEASLKPLLLIGYKKHFLVLSAFIVNIASSTLERSAKTIVSVLDMGIDIHTRGGDWMQEINRARIVDSVDIISPPPLLDFDWSMTEKQHWQAWQWSKSWTIFNWKHPENSRDFSAEDVDTVNAEYHGICIEKRSCQRKSHVWWTQAITLWNDRRMSECVVISQMDPSPHPAPSVASSMSSEGHSACTEDEHCIQTQTYGPPWDIHACVYVTGLWPLRST